jgi:ABC-type antimicrobial peptide transport system permease subunit
MEALMISGTGALAGIIFAIFLAVTINSFISRLPAARGITISVSWLSVALTFIISCSTGLVFGYLPANRAAKLDPHGSAAL